MNREEYNEWEDFRVIKKFTILPLRIYQWSTDRLYWSWLKTTYVLQMKKTPSYYFMDSDETIKQHIHGYFYGYYWKNERLSTEDEYMDYMKWKIMSQK